MCGGLVGVYEREWVFVGVVCLFDMGKGGLGWGVEKGDGVVCGGMCVCVRVCACGPCAVCAAGLALVSGRGSLRSVC